MHEVSKFRLYLLRATYLLIAVGLGSEIWPLLIRQPRVWSLMHGVAICLLATVSLLAVLGIRYPLKMLPLLLFEMVWKTIWLTAIALPLWWTDQLPPNFVGTVEACLMGVIFPIVIPWPYVVDTFVRASGDRWR